MGRRASNVLILLVTSGNMAGNNTCIATPANGIQGIQGDLEICLGVPQFFPFVVLVALPSRLRVAERA
jgi:hypothetical protein